MNTPNVGTWSPPIPRCGTPPPPPPPGSSSISTNGVLHGGQTLVSSSGGYSLAMQSDGNFVEYNGSGRPLWDTQTSGNPGAYAVLQGDGNFVVYSAEGKALWASYTFGSGAETLVMQGDGNVVIYSPSGAPLWANFGATVPTGQTIGSNWFPGGQCTWWAEQLAAGYMGVYPDFNGNADQWAAWASSHGYAVGGAPRVDSVVVFQPGADGAGGVGHVAWVTEVYPNRGTMTLSEMNFVGFDRRHEDRFDRLQPTGLLHLPEPMSTISVEQPARRAARKAGPDGATAAGAFARVQAVQRLVFCPELAQGDSAQHAVLPAPRGQAALRQADGLILRRTRPGVGLPPCGRRLPALERLPQLAAERILDQELPTRQPEPRRGKAHEYKFVESQQLHKSHADEQSGSHFTRHRSPVARVLLGRLALRRHVVCGSHHRVRGGRAAKAGRGQLGIATAGLVVGILAAVLQFLCLVSLGRP